MALNLEISVDPRRLEVDRIHAFLSEEAYWSRGRPRTLTDLAIASSICFGAYADGRQVGFARVVTDYVAVAWIADLFVFEGSRGQGVGRALTRAILDHPELERVRRFALVTLDAHPVYEALGFTGLRKPAMWMERPGPAPHPIG